MAKTKFSFLRAEKIDKSKDSKSSYVNQMKILPEAPLYLKIRDSKKSAKNVADDALVNGAEVVAHQLANPGAFGGLISMFSFDTPVFANLHFLPVAPLVTETFAYITSMISLAKSKLPSTEKKGLIAGKSLFITLLWVAILGPIVTFLIGAAAAAAAAAFVIATPIIFTIALGMNTALAAYGLVKSIGAGKNKPWLANSKPYKFNVRRSIFNLAASASLTVLIGVMFIGAAVVATVPGLNIALGIVLLSVLVASVTVNAITNYKMNQIHRAEVYEAINEDFEPEEVLGVDVEKVKTIKTAYAGDKPVSAILKDQLNFNFPKGGSEKLIFDSKQLRTHLQNIKKLDALAKQVAGNKFSDAAGKSKKSTWQLLKQKFTRTPSPAEAITLFLNLYNQLFANAATYISKNNITPDMLNEVYQLNQKREQVEALYDVRTRSINRELIKCLGVQDISEVDAKLSELKKKVDDTKTTLDSMKEHLTKDGSYIDAYKHLLDTKLSNEKLLDTIRNALGKPESSSKAAKDEALKLFEEFSEASSQLTIAQSIISKNKDKLNFVIHQHACKDAYRNAAKKRLTKKDETIDPYTLDMKIAKLQKASTQASSTIPKVGLVDTEEVSAESAPEKKSTSDYEFFKQLDKAQRLATPGYSGDLYMTLKALRSHAYNSVYNNTGGGEAEFKPTNLYVKLGFSEAKVMKNRYTRLGIWIQYQKKKKQILNSDRDVGLKMQALDEIKEAYHLLKMAEARNAYTVFQAVYLFKNTNILINIKKPSNNNPISNDAKYKYKYNLAKRIKKNKGLLTFFSTESQRREDYIEIKEGYVLSKDVSKALDETQKVTALNNLKSKIESMSGLKKTRHSFFIDTKLKSLSSADTKKSKEEEIVEEPVVRLLSQ